jgi:hypothetical protein
MKRTMKVALFRHRDGHVYPGGENVDLYCKQDIRITEYVNVEFTEIEGEKLQAAIRRARQADIEYHQAQLAALLHGEPGPVSGT